MLCTLFCFWRGHFRRKRRFAEQSYNFFCTLVNEVCKNIAFFPIFCLSHSPNPLEKWISDSIFAKRGGKNKGAMTELGEKGLSLHRSKQTILN